MNIKQKISAVQALFVSLYLLTLMLPLKADAEQTLPLIKAPMDIQQAYQQVSADFQLYQQFLQVKETPLGPVLLNAHNRDEAIIFLGRGFGSELADAICSGFTRYDSELDCLFLIPCDGLPTMGAAEKKGIKYCRESTDLISFQCRFENCYQPGDAYLYKVKTRKQDGYWKIESLELGEA